MLFKPRTSSNFHKIPPKIQTLHLPTKMSPKIFVSNYERPYFYTRPFLPPPPQPPPSPTTPKSHTFNLNNQVTPTLLLIIIILAIIFFISGLLHLLVRYLMRPINRDPDDQFDTNDLSDLQGQLQQLFHLHDSGVDQSYIDTLPVFAYKSVVGVKDPFDCAVCLCEFEGEDKLRLLPKCSHAFHMDCIDTWLLSHSTCPLCRCSLVSDFGQSSCFSPIVLVLESGSAEISRDVGNSDSLRVNSHVNHEEFEFDKHEMVKEDENKEKVVSIKLGKFKSGVGVGGGGGGGQGGEGGGEKQTIDGRRCFSMGSFEYVMNESSSLQVSIRMQVKKQGCKKSTLPITSSHRPAMSECGGDSMRDFKGVEAGGGGSGLIGKSKREGFSLSKIWVRGQKEKAASTLAASVGPPTRGSFSFRFPVHRNESKVNRRTNSELGVGRRDDDQEIQVCQWLNKNSLPLEASNPSSFWVMGRQHIKEVHSSSSINA